MIVYPVYFLGRICPHCGHEDVRFLDKFNRRTKELIYPVNYIVCDNCKRKFFIQWIPEGEDSDVMIPTATSKSAIVEFEKDISEYTINHRRQLD